MIISIIINLNLLFLNYYTLLIYKYVITSVLGVIFNKINFQIEIHILYIFVLITFYSVKFNFTFEKRFNKVN